MLKVKFELVKAVDKNDILMTITAIDNDKESSANVCNTMPYLKRMAHADREKLMVMLTASVNELLVRMAGNDATGT